jgi:hypothetical protein
MPTNLTGSKIKDTYTQVLHVDGGPTGTEKVVYSGTGVATALSLSTGSASVDNIKIDGNTISSTNTNGNINLTPNGTGVVVIPEAEFTTLDAVTFNTVNVAAGMAISNGTITAQGTNTNIDITLTPKGTGSVVIPKVAISGGTASGMTSVAATTVSATTASATTVEGGTVSTTGVAAHLDLSTTSIVADGTNTNIDITMTPKGTGVVSMPRAVVSDSSTSDALRITQTGTGNALVVEDSANPDATPFVVDTNGRVVSGSSTALIFNSSTYLGYFLASGTNFPLAVGYAASSSVGPRILLTKNRSVDWASSTVVVSDDILGQVEFSGADGTNYIPGARITAAVDGTPGSLDMPGRLVFSTTADGASTPTERMRINNAGNVGIGTASPGALLNVVANTSTDAVRITQTGTGNALVVEDNANPDANPFIVDTAGRVVAGHTSALVLAPGTAVPYIQTNLSVSSTDFVSMGISNWFAGAQGASLHLSKARSAAIGTPGVVSANDVIGRVQFNGNDGTGFIASARIEGAVDGTPDTNDMPGRLVFSTTADGASSPTERMRISSTGLVTVAGTLEGATVSTSGVAAHLDLTGTTLSADGTDTNINITISPKGTGEVIITKPFGYGGSGTGGTVTQLTSRTTGVTLNKLSGQITLFAATALSGHASNEFTLTNSFIDPTDVVHVCFASGLTGASYGVTVTAVNSGSCKIAVSNFNNSATPADTPVLNFVVIKGVNA